MTSQILPLTTLKPLRSRASQLIRLATDYGVISKTGAMLTTTSVQFLRSSRKIWLLRPRPPKASLTLSTTPLDHHKTRSTNMVMMELYDAHQRSQGPTLYLHCWTRIVEEAVRRKPSRNLRRTCSWLLRSKRNRRSLLLPALHVLTVPLLSHCTLKLIGNMIRAEPVTAD